jgi:hypothetical protein
MPLWWQKLTDSTWFWGLILLALAGFVVGVIWVNWTDDSPPEDCLPAGMTCDELKAFNDLNWRLCRDAHDTQSCIYYDSGREFEVDCCR